MLLSFLNQQERTTTRNGVLVFVCLDCIFIDACFRIQNFTSGNHNNRDIMNEAEEASKHQYEPPDIVELLTVNSATVPLLSKLGFR